MSEKNNGGPAFPAGARVRVRANPVDPGSDFIDQTVASPVSPGMTLRDYFAAKAMLAHLMNPDSSSFRESEIARAAYQMADAMLSARETT